MGLIDKLKDAGEQATSSARESLEATELRRHLTQAYAALGRIAYGLLEAGTLSDPRLAPTADAIRGLESELAGRCPTEPGRPTS